MENRFENFTYLIMKLSKVIQRIKSLEVLEYGLKAIHVMCLFHLNSNTKGLTSNKLTALTLEDKAAISRALNYLKDEGIVDYEPKKYNGPITLTQKGKALADEISKKADKALSNIGLGITNEERTIMYKSLMIIDKEMNDYYFHLKEKK